MYVLDCVRAYQCAQVPVLICVQIDLPPLPKEFVFRFDLRSSASVLKSVVRFKTCVFMHGWSAEAQRAVVAVLDKGFLITYNGRSLTTNEQLCVAFDRAPQLAFKARLTGLLGGGKRTRAEDADLFEEAHAVCFQVSAGEAPNVGDVAGHLDSMSDEERDATIALLTRNGSHHSVKLRAVADGSVPRVLRVAQELIEHAIQTWRDSAVLHISEMCPPTKKTSGKHVDVKRLIALVRASETKPAMDANGSL